MNQMQQVQQVDPEESKQDSTSFLPDVGDILYICIMQVLLFGRPSFLFQDCSIGWHLAAGQFILEHGQIPRTDIASYSFPDKSWVPYEWFFDLIAACLTNLGGFNLLAVFSASLIAYVFVKTYDWQRSQNAGLKIATLVSIIGIFASAVHWLARPHIITFLCFSIYLSVLQKYERDAISGSKMVIILALAMLLWVNCHPAFPLGLILISIHLFAALIDKAAKEKVKFLIIALATTSATTLINPNFFELHLYILNYLKGTGILANTEEYLSPVFHGNIHAFCLELLIFILIIAFYKYKDTQKISLSSVLISIFSLHLAFSAVRNIPIFVLAVSPLIGFLMQQNANEQVEIRGKNDEESKNNTGVDKSRNKFAEFDQQELRSKKRILSIVYTLVVLVLAFTPNMKTGFNPETTPTKTLDYIDKNLRPAQVGNCGFNLDNWGGLLLYKLKMKVFIDDRADFYGQEFYGKYGTIVQTDPGWQGLLDQFKIKWILMPANAKLVQALSFNPEWSLVAKDEASVIYRRQK
ncbi:MAG: hypothetical protein SFY67_09195 [Candidatus Melainabacteria bacterium]|nr:hypothetical protein [Candidatus Melainabacteria bacterium]